MPFTCKEMCQSTDDTDEYAATILGLH